ncbi:hypothetical protein [Wenjunlia tyrosinilytica]|uniref:hypothetical protein n=1 Tax=Wenjunlia tyrosinilytica TaxID=1544741 RepID=UPI00166CD43D|nr:hypothetical protein [Wenjunlia tyrosinilytica]
MNTPTSRNSGTAATERRADERALAELQRRHGRPLLGFLLGPTHGDRQHTERNSPERSSRRSVPSSFRPDALAAGRFRGPTLRGGAPCPWADSR